MKKTIKLRRTPNICSCEGIVRPTGETKFYKLTEESQTGYQQWNPSGFNIPTRFQEEFDVAINSEVYILANIKSKGSHSGYRYELLDKYLGYHLYEFPEEVQSLSFAEAVEWAIENFESQIRPNI